MVYVVIITLGVVVGGRVFNFVISLVWLSWLVIGILYLLVSGKRSGFLNLFVFGFAVGIFWEFGIGFKMVIICVCLLVLVIGMLKVFVFGISRGFL